MDASRFAASIDQTLLRPTAGFSETDAWCAENAVRGFAALVVAPAAVPLAARYVDDGPTAACSVVGFPLGYQSTETKADEAAQLVVAGAGEIDVVLHIGALLEGELAYVERDLQAVADSVREASEGRGLVKVILETGYLSEEAIVEACAAARRAGADFVKTSTGFGPRGASVEDVRIMRDAVGGSLRIKAAGGIRDLATALALIDAGADRLGTSAGGALVDAFVQAESSAR